MIAKTEGLSYVGDTEGHSVWSRYTWFIEDRRVFDVLVDNSDATEAANADGVGSGASDVTLHRIYIARVDAPASTAQITKGYAAKRLHMDEVNGESVAVNHIDGQTVTQYVKGRAATFLARLFVPAA